MRIKICGMGLLLALAVFRPAHAMDMADEHGPQIFHAFRFEADRGGAATRWNLKGWIGSDENKLWLRSEGETASGKTRHAELQALYSRNISTFWDLQAGLRHDFRLKPTSYLVVGVQGLAPYFFETEAHLFVSDNGDVSVRLREENDFLVTQRLILQPYAEVSLFAQSVPKQETGAGLAQGEIGLQTRYEFTRKFAPYVDVRYERKFGETASFAKSSGEDAKDFITSAGVRLMF